ncbi:retention module-containing protein [Shewanella rhizosphaerae]|uniref:retention module-containing protein n=1 Tax=Shewanella rhizosphaerae TaxID=2864207 RepID=UPI001C660BEE|nr:retention module-containing protein [Shewanella rhizosphaerae]QYK13242.1 retention module-containing protein [Shewanella rhizosphaerae]
MGASITTQDAVVVNLVGELKVKDEQGNIREVKIGDLIHAGEQLIFSPNAKFNLEYEDGSSTTQANLMQDTLNQDTTVSQDTSQGQQSDAAPQTDTPVALDPEIAALQAQILAGEDPTQGLPETAAGAGTPTNQGDAYFVSVGRTGDETLADAGWDTAGFPLTPDTTVEEVIIPELQPSAPTVSSATFSLFEANLAQGSSPSALLTNFANSIQTAADAGISSLTINGINIISGGQFAGPIVINTPNGVLTITGFDSASGQFTYDYAFNSSADHSAGDQLQFLFNIELVDNQGDIATGTITVNIIDDQPEGFADSNAVTEDTAIVATGNVLGNDIQGADSAEVTAVTNSQGTSISLGETNSIQGQFGVLTLFADGSYSYQLNNGASAVQSLALGQQITETFNYLLTDSDGDSVLVPLTITITGTNDTPIITSNIEAATGSVLEAGVMDGGNVPEPGSLVTGGTLTAADVDNGASWTWSGVPQVSDYGTFSINASTGEWSYTLADNALVDALAQGETHEETFLVTVTDEHGAYSTQLVTVTVTGTNDIPVITSNIEAATGSVLEAGVMDGGNVPEPGSLVTGGTLTAADVDNGASWTWSGVPQVSDYGTFSINASTGEWSYTLADNALVDALAQGETHEETFLVTVTDEHGAYSTQLVTVTVTGTNDIPVITSNIEAATGSVLEAGVMDGGNVPEPGSLVTGGTLTAADVDNGASWTWSGVPQVSDYGTFSINASTGEWSYTLADNALVDALAQGETHEETFLVTVTDEHGAYSTQLVTVTVTGTNDIPVITSNIEAATGSVLEAGVMDGGNVPEPGSLVTGGTLTAADVDNGASWTWSGVPQVSDYGTFSINASTGEWSYTLADNALVDALAQGETHEETFLVTVTDEHGAYSTQLVTVTVTGTNDIPVITSNIEAATGSVLEAGVMDGGNVPEPGSLVTGGTLTAADVDNGASWTWSGVPQVSDYGTFSINASTGEWSYTLADNALVDALAQGETHEETFLVTVTDEHGAYSTQLVTVTVTGTNDIPVITSNIEAATGSVLEAGVMDGGNVPEPGSLVTGGTLTAADVDNGASWTWSGVPQVSDYGTFSINASTGEWSYTLADNALVDALAQGETHEETFLVTVTDEHGAYSTQLVTVTVTGTNDIPVITSNIEAATGSVLEAGVMDGGNVPEPGSLVTGGTLTAADVDNGASWTWSGVPQVSDYGTFSINASTGEWSYTLADNALVDALAQGETHEETFLVTVTDEHGAYSTQLVTVTVTGTNDIPVITSNIEAATGSVLEAGVMDGGNVPEPGSLVTGGTLTAADVDNGASWTWSGVPQVSDYGTFSINASTGEWSYTLADNALVDALAQGETHEETFLVTVTDEHGAYSTQLVTVTVTGTNDIPVITSNIEAATGSVLEAGVMDGGNVPEPGSLVTGGTLTAADVDNGASWTWSGVPQVSDYGTFSINASTGEWSYTLADNALVDALAQGETHEETFLVTVTDEHGAYSTQLVTVTVTGTNDIPVITSNIEAATGSVLEAGVMDGGNVPEPGSLVTGGTLTAADVDNGASWTWSGVPQVSDYGTFSINASTGEWSYTLADNALVDALAQGETHEETFLVTVTDEHGAYSTQLVTVTVTGTNDIPVITSNIEAATGSVLEAGVMDGGNVPEPGSLVTGGTLTAADVDNGASWTWSGVPQVSDYGTFSINASTGEWSYTLADNALVDALAQGETHEETFLVTVTDEHGAYSTQLVTVTVTGTNDIPVITSNIEAATGSVLEAGVMDGGNVPEPGSLVTGGTLTAADVDNGASWTWSGVPQVSDYGTFSINASTGEWSYTLADNALVDALAQGETHEETFLVTVTDEHGAYSTQLVTVTVTGTNDIPVITSNIEAATGSVLEAGVMDGGNVPEPGSLVTGGTLTAADVDNGASWTWSGVPQVSDYGTFSINASTGEWSYTLADNALVDALAQGETHEETFLVTVTDEHGAYSTQLVTVTVTGTNDIPVITSNIEAATGSVLEAGVMDGGNVPEPGSLVTGGTLTAADVDNGASWTWSGVPQVSDYGTFSINASTGEWSYTLADNALVDALAQGETHEETFLVTVTDEHGAYSTQLVTVTVTGTNDIPVITSNIEAATGSVLEAGVMDGGNVPEPGSLVTGGTLTAADVDNGASWTWSGVPQVSDYGTFSINASTGEWSYTLADNALVDALAQGETHEETFLVTVTDEHGAYSTQLVTVTVTGTNDIPVITSNIEAATGSVLEAGVMDGGNVPEPGSLVTGGTLTAADVDNGASWTWSGVPQVSDYGTFSINASTGEWSYTLADNALVDALAQGETHEETFLVTVTDEHGAYSTQLVTVTVTGTNDIPVITSNIEAATGSVLEAGVMDGGNVPEPGSLVTGGTLTAADVDNGASWTWSGVPQVSDYGTFSINASTGEWSYTLADNALVDALAQGETHEETFLVTVTDEHGAYSTQLVTVTVTGTNDIPVITSNIEAATGSVLEAGVMDGGNVPEPGSLVTGGTLTAADVDNGASWTWSGVPQVSDYGTFSINASTGEWSYTLADNALVDALAQGETHEETFLVTVTDEHGAYSTQLVTVTVTGTNDIPVITSNIEAATGSVLEAGVMDGGNVPEPGSLVTGGTLTAADVDNGASWTWSGVPQVSDYGTFSINASTGEWSYTLADNALVNALAQGETHEETFLVTVTDEHGAYSTQLVTVTVTGTNDIPVLTIDKTSGLVTEDDSDPMLTDTGTLSFTDVDDEYLPEYVGHDLSASYVANSLMWSGGDITDVLSADQIQALIDGFSVYQDHWDYSILNSLVQFLAANETITLSFDVTVTDKHGAYDTQTVTITINGNNDPIEGEFAKEIWVPASLAEIAIPYLDGYPLGIDVPTDQDYNDVITITGLSLSFVDPDETADIGEIWYVDDDTGVLTLYDFDNPVVLSASELGSLVYVPGDNAGIEDQLDINLTFTVNSGSDSVDGNFVIHTVPANSLGGNTVLIGDGSSPLTSGNDQDAYLTVSSAFASAINLDPSSGALDLFTDFQKSPFDIPIPNGEIGGQTGIEREEEVSVRLTINGITFIVIAAANGVTDWFYDANSGLMSAHISYTNILMESDNSITLADYLGANPVDPGDIWTITYLDNDGGSYQARFVQATFTHELLPDTAVTVTGTDNVDNLIFGTTEGDSLTGANLDDEIYGREGNDSIFGLEGDDQLIGGSGDDLIEGGSGNDIILGGLGNDTIDGGIGADILIGGAGSDTIDAGIDSDIDTFVWDVGSDDNSVDTVLNFDISMDKLDLSAILVDEESGVYALDQYLAFNFSGGNTEISVDANHDGVVDLTIVLNNVDLTNNNTLSDAQIINNLLGNENLVIDTIP